MNHGTLIKHDETMCHAQESLLLLSYLWSYFPLIIFHTVSCPLYNLKTVRDISMKLCTLIKQYVTGPDPDFGPLGGGTTQHEGTGHQLIKSEKMQ